MPQVQLETHTCMLLVAVILDGAACIRIRIVCAHAPWSKDAHPWLCRVLAYAAVKEPCIITYRVRKQAL